MKKKNPNLVKEWDNAVRHGSKPIIMRAYCSDNLSSFGDRTHYIWYLAFPKEVIDPIMVMLETEPYFGGQHEFEIDGFYLYPVFGHDSNNLIDVIEHLRNQLKFYIGAYKDCVGLYRIWRKKLKDK